jgi:hypothetical protein
MRRFETDEVVPQLIVTHGGDHQDRAAAIAVLAAALADSHNLGRLVVNQGRSDWSDPQLRNDLEGGQQKTLRRPLN